jgi:hypothetical protein
MKRKVPGNFVTEQHADLVEKVPKTTRRAIAFAHKRELVLNQGMVDKMQIVDCHGIDLR